MPLVAGQERRGLVGGEVEQPYDDRSPAQHLEHRPECLPGARSDGQPVAARNGSSVRSSPTPSAPASSARRASVVDDTLASSVTSTPSVVVAGSARGPRSSAADGVPGAVRRAAVRSSGATTTSPAAPSTRTGTPSAASMTAGSTPTTSGTPSERATIDACEPAPPSTETAPAT